MEKLFSLEYGIGGICVLLTVMILLKVAEFLLAASQKKETLTEKAVTELTQAVRENTRAVEFLEIRMKGLETGLSEFPKIKTDLRRFYAALKEIAGERWPTVRDEIMKDGYPV